MTPLSLTKPKRYRSVHTLVQRLGARPIAIDPDVHDLEHLSPERGGTLTILVSGEGSAAQTAELLEAQGYGVVVAPVIEE